MKKILTFAAAGLLAVMAANAVPAKPGIRTITQPDGTTVQAELRGDEFCSFYVGADGKPMKFDADGFLRYVVEGPDGTIALTADAAQAADIPATLALLGRAGAAERVRMNAPEPATAAAAVAGAAARAAVPGRSRDELPQTGLGLMGRQTFPVLGEIKSVVILVSYQDVDFTVANPLDYYNRHLNEEGFSEYDACGSCRDFFVENSMGQFQPTFDVFGPYKLSKNRSYYGSDSGSRHDPYAYQMITEACAALDSQIDFSQYDLDGDGYVDNIYVIYAGQGQASYGGTETVWPHSSTIVNGPTHDGVRIGRYATSNEWEYQRPDGIGTFVHEFSHVMGLPDLYDVTYSGKCTTPGSWDAMDQGPYNENGTRPPFYSAYERNALGWIDLTLIDGPASIDLIHIGQSNDACLIQTMRNNEFFLLENRQKTGWDAATPGRGLLVWHIDFDQSVFNQNNVSVNPSHQYVDIVECNGGKGAASGYPFPGTAFVKEREISPERNPLQPWIGPVVPYYITKITEQPKSGEPNHVTFYVDGGLAAIDIPVALEASDLSAEGFTANWTAVDGAAKYALTVYADRETTQGPVALDFGTPADRTVVLPEGWTFSGEASDIYTTAGFCGNAIPSLKFAANGAVLTSPLFDAEVAVVSFFLRAAAVKDPAMVVVEGRSAASDAWMQVAEAANLASVNTTGKTFAFDIADSHVCQLRFIFYASTGKVGMDDLTLTFATSSRTIFADFDNKAVADATSVAVEVPEGSALKFSYRVRAYDAAGIPGALSNEISVDLSPYAGLDNVTVDADAPVEYYNLQGIRVANPTPGNLYIRRTGNSTTKVVL